MEHILSGRTVVASGSHIIQVSSLRVSIPTSTCNAEIAFRGIGIKFLSRRGIGSLQGLLLVGDLQGFHPDVLHQSTTSEVNSQNEGSQIRNEMTRFPEISICHYAVLFFRAIHHKRCRNFSGSHCGTHAASLQS